VVSIPLDLAERIPGVASEIDAEEQAIIELCQSPGFSAEKLLKAVRPHP
jgi:hypothetical protein